MLKKQNLNKKYFAAHNDLYSKWLLESVKGDGMREFDGENWWLHLYLNMNMWENVYVCIYAARKKNIVTPMLIRTSNITNPPTFYPLSLKLCLVCCDVMISRIIFLLCLLCHCCCCLVYVCVCVCMSNFNTVNFGGLLASHSNTWLCWAGK